MPRVDYSEGARAFRASRTPPAHVLAAWGSAVQDVGLPPVSRVLDLGAGTGAFLDPLTDWLSAPVVAVEPSAAMRAEAAAIGLTDRFPYVAGSAEHIALAPASVDVAWLSTVVHQLDDPRRAAAELHRVLVPGGHVLVRGFFSDVPVTGLWAAFPGAERAAAAFPSTDEVVSCFAAAGFRLAHVAEVTESWRLDLDAWRDRVQRLRHVDSAFRPLTDHEVAEGLRRVEDRYRTTVGPIPSAMTLRLVVLRT